MEFSLLMRDILDYASCKFEMYIFKIALLIIENLCIAFLYVLSIFMFVDFLYSRSEVFDRVLKVISSDNIIQLLTSMR